MACSTAAAVLSFSSSAACRELSRCLIFDCSDDRLKLAVSSLALTTSKSERRLSIYLAIDVTCSIRFVLIAAS
eukprot:CAMPEP_0113894076 /NCGR_PEP_ID=MMETSP0780_2-20120614/16483_1 /TAXON_ID=652834 /ORGANISM="Palpitomonas bilix" /LENGTH=72 /DNA_ID=CAMNT_0000884509 /DNA_START=23 /DNA_END=237 /DNA_ORIENTATION=+ /assembly_acc=CAM_ASM_000599